MNEFLKKARARMAVSAAATRAFYARNRVLVLGGLTMLSILLIVWARLGFTLNFNRFYAANTCTEVAGQFCYPGGANAPSSCPAPNTSGVGTCDVGQCCKPPSAGSSGVCPLNPLNATGMCNIGTVSKSGATITVTFEIDGSQWLGCQTEQPTKALRFDTFGFVSAGDNPNAPTDGIVFNNIQKDVPSGPYKITETRSYTFKTAGPKRVFNTGRIAGAGPFCTLPSSAYVDIGTVTDADLGGGGDGGGGDGGGGDGGGGGGGGGGTPSPGTLRLDSCTSGVAKLSWTKGANANINLLQRIYTDNTNSYQDLSSDPNTTSFTDTIPAGISYNYRVKSGANVVSNTVTCANSGGSTAPASITTRCEGWPTPRVVVNWVVPSDAVQNTIRRTGTAGSFTDADALLLNPPTGTTTYTDTTVQTGATYGYMYRPVGTINPRSDVTINAASCGGPTPTVTVAPTATPPPGCYFQEVQCVQAPCPPQLVCPTVTPTQSPASGKVACAPVSQTVAVGQQAKVTASGGTAGFSWKTVGAKSADVFISGTLDENLTVTYRSAGPYTVTASSGSNRAATCEIEVVGTPTPAPSATMALTVAGRNVSSGAVEGTTVAARGGQQVEVIVRARNTSTTAILANLVVRASLPNGLAYINGSTTYNNAAVALDSVVTSGLGVGSLGPSQEAVVRFRARVNSASFPVGTTPANVVATVNADGAGPQSGSVVISVTRPAPGTSSGAVPTGPGDAVLVALLVSGIVTLLYVSYTRSPLYRRQEAEHLSEDQGPMDFRG